MSSQMSSSSHDEGEDSKARHVELVKRWKNLLAVLGKTEQNLHIFMDQCKENPSQEVEGLARFHQDRVMQIQVELRSLRGIFKDMRRERLAPLRQHRRPHQPPTATTQEAAASRGLTSLSLDVYRQIFAHVVEYDGILASKIPQVCSLWRNFFSLSKHDWRSLAVCRPIVDLRCAANVMDGCALTQLKLLFDESAPPMNPEAMSTILSSHSSCLVSLSLSSPGPSLAHVVEHMPSQLTELRIENTHHLDIAACRSIATRLVSLKSLHIAHAPGFNDACLSQLVSAHAGAGSTIKSLSIAGCRDIHGASLRHIARGCLNLESINIANCNVSPLSTLQEITSLTHLSLSPMNRTDATSIADFIRNSSTTLRTVVLPDVGHLYSPLVDNLITSSPPLLTKLVIGPCSSLTPEQFSAVVAALPSLVHLAVYGASLLGDQALISITTCLPALEKLCLTETSGFTDAGLFAMEELTCLHELSLHPMDAVSSAGLRVLGDFCDNLECLFLGRCPAATTGVMLRIAEGCNSIKVLVATHVPPVSPEDVQCILEANCNITCLALVPASEEQYAPNSADTAGGDSSGGGAGVVGWDQEVQADVETADNASIQGLDDTSTSMELQSVVPSLAQAGSIAPRTGCDSSSASDIMRQYPHTAVCTTWQSLDKVLLASFPALADLAQTLHSAVDSLLEDERARGSFGPVMPCIESVASRAKRLIKFLVKATGVESGAGQTMQVMRRKLRVLREAVVIELGSRSVWEHIRILVEIDLVLDLVERNHVPASAYGIQNMRFDEDVGIAAAGQVGGSGSSDKGGQQVAMWTGGGGALRAPPAHQGHGQGQGQGQGQGHHLMPPVQNGAGDLWVEGIPDLIGPVGAAMADAAAVAAPLGAWRTGGWSSLFEAGLKMRITASRHFAKEGRQWQWPTKHPVFESKGRAHDRGKRDCRSPARSTKSDVAYTEMLVMRLVRMFPDRASARALMQAKCLSSAECALVDGIKTAYFSLCKQIAIADTLDTALHAGPA